MSKRGMSKRVRRTVRAELRSRKARRTEQILGEFCILHRLAAAKFFLAQKRKDVVDAQCHPDSLAGFLGNIFSSTAVPPREMTDRRVFPNIPQQFLY